jgi:hypothetical protein
MRDIGALITSNINMAKLCQNVGGGVGAKPKNCQALIGGKTAISNPQLIQNRRKLVLVTIKNVFVNLFMRSMLPNDQKLSHADGRAAPQTR